MGYLLFIVFQLLISVIVALIAVLYVVKHSDISQPLSVRRLIFTGALVCFLFEIAHQLLMLSIAKTMTLGQVQAVVDDRITLGGYILATKYGAVYAIVGAILGLLAWLVVHADN
jgi:hypothetical protein